MTGRRDMESLDPLLWLAVLALIVLAAALYSSVGHGGASGYLAVMALAGLSPAFMKPAALGMNIVVAGYVFFRLWRAGHFDGRLFAPFAIASIPLAALGGAWTLHDYWYRGLVGAALLVAAARLFMETRDTEPRGRPNVVLAMAIGAVLGLLSGLTGVGGGIFLSPVLLFLGWTSMRQNAAMAAAFILVNSIAGLAGHLGAGKPWPADIPYFMIAALAGGLIGAELAVRRLAPVTLKKLLGVVLVIAGAKMFLST
jgi:uncharacterized membrane protein YfcA